MNAAPSRPQRAHRAARAPAPPLPVFDRLDATHRQMMQTLEELQRLLDALDEQGVNDESRAMARSICTFFDANAREHHAAEERFVFPPLLNAGDAELTQHVQRLQQDHGWLEEDWIELRPQLSAVAEGYSLYDLDYLRAAVPVFSELYRDHIALEENTVYPASRQASG